MRVGNFNCKAGHEDRDGDRAVYALLHMAWFYVAPPDPRTGERTPLLPLGMSPRTLEDANVINAFFKEHNGKENEDFTAYGFLGTAPEEASFEVAWPESVWELQKRYVEAWIGVKGHGRFSEFYQSVHKKLKDFKDVKDSEWKELEEVRKEAAIADVTGGRGDDSSTD